MVRVERYRIGRLAMLPHRLPRPHRVLANKLAERTIGLLLARLISACSSFGVMALTTLAVT